MTDLTKLSVSLTKHGAHKISFLLKKYGKDGVLSNVRGQDEGVNIDAGQARKNLSIGSDGVVPVVWNAARACGDAHVDALVFIAIIFSHYELIDAMRTSGTAPYVGTIRRDNHLNGKAYTNFAHIIEELGFATAHEYEQVSYDVSKLFQLPGLAELVRGVLTLKLQKAGWSGVNTLEEECAALGMHEVFGIDAEKFTSWLASDETPDEIEDRQFFSGDEPNIGLGVFEFSAGHNQRKVGVVPVRGGGQKMANLLHNKIQNELYARLCDQFGQENVGTENPTGDGTSIDLVVKQDAGLTFYEIKTAGTLKACIRQAIPQLLEYAFWKGTYDRAKRLVIVSPHELTEEAKIYLEFLKEQFKLPLEYEQFK